MNLYLLQYLKHYLQVRPHIPQLQDIQLHTTILSNDAITIERIEPPSLDFDHSNDVQSK